MYVDCIIFKWLLTRATEIIDDLDEGFSKVHSGLQVNF